MLVKTDYFMTVDWANVRWNKKVVLVSGGFDPLHIGHLNYLIDASRIDSPNNILVAVVNGDEFLKRKKKYNFMKQHERAMIVDHIKGVNYTLIWEDKSQYVDGALNLVKPDIFAKGGDRSSDSEMPEPELHACEKLGIEIRYGIGGANKLNSSSELLENFQKFHNSD